MRQISSLCCKILSYKYIDTFITLSFANLKISFLFVSLSLFHLNVAVFFLILEKINNFFHYFNLLIENFERETHINTFF